jgi:hypothetical protein
MIDNLPKPQFYRQLDTNFQTTMSGSFQHVSTKLSGLLRLLEASLSKNLRVPGLDLLLRDQGCVIN